MAGPVAFFYFDPPSIYAPIVALSGGKSGMASGYLLFTIRLQAFLLILETYSNSVLPELLVMFRTSVEDVFRRAEKITKMISLNIKIQ